MALSKDRLATKERNAVDFQFPVEGATKIFAGALVVMNAAGFIQPGTVATTHVAAFRAEEQVDNSAGADGAVTVKVKRGCFQFKNSSAGDLIALTDVNKPCYVVDDETVAKTNGANTRSAAGIVRDVDAAGVWVEL